MSLLENEIRIELSTGVIAAKVWGTSKGAPVLALHGWLDNAASFDLLAPLLLKKNPNLYIIAIDFPGHGHSYHFSSEMGSFFIEYVSCVLAIIEKLNLYKVSLLGHSMGGGVSVLVAGARPEKIVRVILLESNGPLTKPDNSIISSYRKFLDDISDISKKKYISRTYTSKEVAKIIKVRQRASQINYRGSSQKNIRNKFSTLEPISNQSARILVERNMKKINQNKYSWSIDHNLRATSSVFLTEKQLISFIREIKASVCCIFAEDSPLYFFIKKKFKSRFRRFKRMKLFVIPTGGHHLHMQEPELVAKKIQNFLD